MFLAGWLFAAFLSTLPAALWFARFGAPPGPGHWTARARVAWNLRRARRGPLATAIFCAAVAGAVAVAPRVGHPVAAVAGAGAMAAALPLLLERWRFEGRLLGDPRWLRRGLLTLLGQLPLGVLAACALLMPASPGPEDAILVAIAAVGLVFGRSLVVAILAALGLARPATGDLRDAVDAAARRLGVRPGTPWVADLPGANLWASPFWPGLVVTREAAEALPPDELQGAATHLLAGVRGARGALASILPGLTFLPLVAVRPATQLGAAAAFATFAAIVGLLVVVVRLGRAATLARDALAATIDGPAIARGLERLHAVNLVPAVLARGSHPSLADRMAAAGVTPDGPRPEAPGREGLAATLPGQAAAFVGTVGLLLGSVYAAVLLR